MRWRPPPRPDWVTGLLAQAECAGGAAQLVGLDPQELQSAACASTGLSDFGDDVAPGAGAWRAHYACLLEALERESRLHLLGRLQARAEILRSLRNRLRLAALWRERPEILAEPVPAPVFIVGSPRTGTSILHELMACDPDSRTPAMWEMAHPVEALSGESLRAPAHHMTTFWHHVQPEYRTMHSNSGELPNECIFITMNEFLSDHWSGVHDVPGYAAHQRAAEDRGAYRFHRRFLQTLQQRGRGVRWVLKAPSHLETLRELFQVYPDARVVHIHRDPCKTLPSALSLMGTLKWMRCEEVDLARAASALPRGYEILFRREIEARASGALPDARFVDVRFHDLVADPAAALSGLYDRLGWELRPELRRAVETYVAGKPRAAEGAHRYEAADFGLDPGEIRERFRFYRQRFEVPEEG